MKQLTKDEIKKAVGAKAASLVKDGMHIGLGTGSTATYFIESLIERCRTGLKIAALATSCRSQELAKKGGIPVLDMDSMTSLDLTIDGADEIDPKNQMIKGGGGALLGEKILATSSHKMLIIVDSGKLVDVLGKFGLPVEIIPFCYFATISKIRKLGYEGNIRIKSDGSFYVTDSGNYIFDIHSPKAFPNPEQDHDQIRNLTGVVETGFFFNLPVWVLVGYPDGSVQFREEEKAWKRA
jgi:ribose 5-phosphate isomerase A